MAEIASRNAMRLGKKRKLKLKHLENNGGDSDEEERRQLEYLQADSSTSAKMQRRLQARELAKHDRQMQQTRQCWWWLESSSFDKATLIALGRHVALVMAPSKLSIQVGKHLYIVPISHCESLTSASDEIWDEIVRFQTSLRRVNQSLNQTVLFCETFFNRGFWQTRLECIFVEEKEAAMDAPLFFRSALMEQAQEWGTHQKLISTNEKGLRRCVPPNFAYFYVEYDPPHQGYVQLIESNDFPKSFASDTICGMLGNEPLRMRPRSSSTPSMNGMVKEFQALFAAPFDWTAELGDD